ncbi:unnamed protein product [Lactuca virosa]|uniref:glutathione transferase n=1 Tax=Lactuca virosa TaxID=75947 RepID=A0AAU9NBC3_9ASTR|nr:unnamed protein product [Lactuca virosa]
MPDEVKLYAVAGSPFVCRAKIALNMKGIKYEKLGTRSQQQECRTSQDPYEKVVARFWAKFIDEKCIPALYKAFGPNGNEETDKEACEQLQILENELKVKGTKFFGGDNINLVDIAADFIAYWLGIIQEAAEKTLFTKDKFPKLTQWADDFVNLEVVNQVLLPRERLLAFFKKRFGKA